jgi:hypothetical protein
MRKVMAVAVLGAAAVMLLGFVVMSLWNWLLPTLFGLPVIGFWQALGLFLLSKLLFGGFHGGHRRESVRRRMRERLLERLTPEQRERLRGAWRGCGEFGAGPESAERG